MERTLAIIKPDAVERHLIGAIVSRIESAGQSTKLLSHSCPTLIEGGAFVFRSPGRCPPTMPFRPLLRISLGHPRNAFYDICRIPSSP